MLNNSTYAYLGMKNGEYGGGGAKSLKQMIGLK